MSSAPRLPTAPPSRRRAGIQPSISPQQTMSLQNRQACDHSFSDPSGTPAGQHCCHQAVYSLSVFLSTSFRRFTLLSIAVSSFALYIRNLRYLPPISHSSTNHAATSAAIRNMSFPMFFQALPASGPSGPVGSLLMVIAISLPLLSSRPRTGDRRWSPCRDSSDRDAERRCCCAAFPARGRRDRAESLYRCIPDRGSLLLCFPCAVPSFYILNSSFFLRLY